MKRRQFIVTVDIPRYTTAKDILRSISYALSRHFGSNTVPYRVDPVPVKRKKRA
jgi:hypothetical protein